MAQDPYRYFRVEARELLDQLLRGALDLEKAEQGAEPVSRLLRLAHTLKGAARVVKQAEIAGLAHEIEDVLEPLRDTSAAADREHVEAIFGRLDALGGHVEALAIPAAPVSDDNKEPREAGPRSADTAELDALLDGVGEVRVELALLRRKLERLGDARILAEALTDSAPARRGREAVRDGGGVASAAHLLAAELRTDLGDLQRGLDSSLDRIERDLSQVRTAAERLRMAPARVLFNALERTARDAALALGKQIRFEGRGGETRMDAHVIGAVQGALVQLVRNAAAHGVEPPDGRAGKPKEGSIRLTIARRGRCTAISCEDDGAGVDLEAVRRAARRKGVLPAGAASPSAETLLDLLLTGGVSTAQAVSGVAGRGVGLDVVRETAERLGGQVSIRSETGQGTTVELLLPLSVSSVEALLVESGGGAAAIPLDAVRRVVRLQAADVARSAQGETVLHDGQAIPFAPLSALLGAKARAYGARPQSAVVVDGDGALAAIGVERPLGMAAVVPHPLPDLAPPSALVAGVALDEDGAPQLVLDIDNLVRAARHAGGAPDEPRPLPRPLLVVDDSLTTRMLEQSILETAGYRVQTAKSGEEGLEAARRERPALLLVDVEMPGMDGFTFIEQVRGDPDLRETPAILVTSRASPEDRRRGEEVGAQGYIVKGEFDQTGFLLSVRRLVG
ncbi:response regulator [Phenylobacterium sp. LjRoot225]|uniref:hybrid sensor histidine kinase/response regulator n=1 Tax=Phenylobacterium sp. LjRoot225 TaxID=3342285 RepID=UPI003ECF1309